MKLLFIVLFSLIAVSAAYRAQDEFICKEKNDYFLDRFAAFPDFLQLDSTAPVQWKFSADGREATAEGEGTRGMSAIFSGDVWTGRVSFTATIKDVSKDATKHVGMLVGVVSPRSKFIMVDWLGENYSGFTCESRDIPRGYVTRKAGITVRAIHAPLGDSETAQHCNVLSPVDQENIVSVWEHWPTSISRERDVAYFWNVTIDTFTDKIYVVIRNTQDNHVVVAEEIEPKGDWPVRNFSMGTIGPFVVQSNAVFNNMSVTPLSCTENALANCGYGCPMHGDNETIYNDEVSADDDDGEGIEWWGIFLIILFICVICCCIGVCLAFLIVCVLSKA